MVYLFVCFLFSSSIAHTVIVIDHGKVFLVGQGVPYECTWNLDLGGAE